MSFISLAILVIVALGVAYKRGKPNIWVPLIGVVLIIVSIFSLMDWLLLVPAWIIYLLAASITYLPKFRQALLTRALAKLIRKNLPPISDTEREALEAGDVWWEGELFNGRPNWQMLLKTPRPQLTTEEQAFLDNQVETLCGMLNDWQIVHELKDLPMEVWDYLKQQGFFGMIIPKQYGGLEFSALAHSTVVQKIASRSVSAAVTTMVPNSLGPAELLLHYGTAEQKQHYLPALARGEEIPCFALTGPEAGSDAAAMQDTGIVCKGQFNGEEVLGIRLNWEKHYITLAPVATILGLAFKLYDPDHLLGEKEELGITLCLIPTTHQGVEVGERHFPLSAAFMNGPTRGKNVFVPIDWIIGGPQNAGKGWRMLMECLAAGRSISLPALSTAMGKLAYRMTGAYSKIRQQFNVSIGNFGGVGEALAIIAGNTYMLEATRLLTTSALDQHIAPSLVSAIAKYNMTEMGRKIINAAMDIHAGRGIQAGPKNYLANYYTSAPIAITVEGANILTRNLIIFGQGVMRCHPYVIKELEALSNPDPQQALPQFDKLLIKHAGYTLSNFARTLLLGLSNGLFAGSPLSGKLAKYYRQLTRFSSALALVADISLLMLGGELKRRENLSARLGDVLSNLYIASAVLKYYQDQEQTPEQLAYVDWTVSYCLQQIEITFHEFFRNFPNKVVGFLLNIVVFPLGNLFHRPSDKLSKQLSDSMMHASALRDQLTQHCYTNVNPDDNTGLIEAAFLKRLAAEPALRKITQARRQGNINSQLELTAQIDAAVAQQIISKEEAQVLYEYEKLYNLVIRVDSFPADFFSK